MNISKHNDKWRVQVYKNGIRKSKIFDSKTAAKMWGQRIEVELADAKPENGFTFGDAVAKYQAEVSSKKDGEVWELRRLNAMLEHFKSDTLLTEIDTPQIGAWRDKRLKTVSGSTVVRDANLLRNVFAIARIEWKWMQHKPFDGVNLPKENQPRQTVWGWQLIKRVLRAERIGKTREVQDAFHIALRSGMRLGEVLSSVENFDPRAQVVTIKTKTEQVARIPIGRIAAKLLMRPPFVVDANEGSVLFSKLCRELLIEGLTFHDTRATALTHLAKKVDVMTLAKISRHKDLSLLMNVYYRPNPSDIAKSI